MKIDVGKSLVVDAIGQHLQEPDKLDPQRDAYVRAFYPQLMEDFPPQGRDLMFTIDNIKDIAKTREVLDHLEWLYVQETGGYVLRGDQVHRGKQCVYAIFKTKDDLPTETPTQG